MILMILEIGQYMDSNFDEKTIFSKKSRLPIHSRSDQGNKSCAPELIYICS